jgi:hypothetical protein
METAPPVTVWGVITDFLASNPSPQEIIDYRLPDELQARAHELLNRNSAGTLTHEEREEMFDISRADMMMSLLKAKTELKMRKSNS